MSKMLSYVLRHKPEHLSLALDAQGYVSVSQLLTALSKAGTPLTGDELKTLVDTNDKRRFAFSGDGERIRASQGHSVEVDADYPPSEPPEVLYHGTTWRFLESIWSKGLLKGERKHVHLSADRETAVNVGKRHGKPVVLEVEAGRMHRDGLRFYFSANGVWLTEHVPSHYLRNPACECDGCKEGEKHV